MCDDTRKTFDGRTGRWANASSSPGEPVKKVDIVTIMKPRD